MMPHFRKLSTPPPPPPTTNKHPLSVSVTCPVSTKSPPQRYLSGFTVLYIGIDRSPSNWWAPGIEWFPAYSVRCNGWQRWPWASGQTILSFKAMPAKQSPQKLSWPVFPNENCLINLSTEALCVWVNTLHRISLKQQCPCVIDPLKQIHHAYNVSLPVAWRHIQLSVPKSI